MVLLVAIGTVLHLRSLVREGTVVLSNGAQLRWTSCWFGTPSDRRANCAWFEPSLDREPTGTRLRVAVFHARALSDAPVLLYATGGPGGSAWIDADTAPVWWAWLDALAVDRDLVLVDWRGTGGSEPALECGEVYDAALRDLPRNLSASQEARSYVDAIAACRRRLLDLGHDLRALRTEVHARDLGEIMDLLGVDRWDLYGVSYGTRTALELARRSGRRVRSLVLDSSLPNEINAQTALFESLRRAIDLILETCAQDAACDAAIPTPKQALEKTWERLRADPPTVPATLPGRGRVDVVVNPVRFTWALLDLTYNPAWLPESAALLRAIAAGDDALLAALIQTSIDLLYDPTLSTPVSVSVRCADEGPISEAERRAATQPAWWHEAAFVPKVFDVCAVSPGEGSVPEPPTTRLDVPTLVLSGARDAVTLPEWSTQLRPHLERNVWIRFPEASHGVVDTDPCAARTVGVFLEAPGARPTNACLARVGAVVR